MRLGMLPPARVEQFFGYLRLLGIVLGVPVIVLADLPRAEATLLWIVQAVLVVGTAALWWWRRRSPRSGAIMHVGFALDAVVVAGWSWGFAHVAPARAWTLVFPLLADAALRYGVLGAVLGLVLAMAVFAVHSELRAADGGRPFGLLSYLYVAATLAGTAAVLAVFSLVVEQQTAVVRDQALRLAAVQRMRERLVATSSHEFRGPLAAISSGVQTVRRGLERLDPDRVRAMLDEVLRQSAHLQRLSDDLLAVARAQTEHLGLRAEPGALGETVRLAVAAAAPYRRGHLLEVQTSDVVCVLDHERLRQVVRNLVENAFKYTPDGGRVSVRAVHDGANVELTVADSGPGIPAAAQARVFEPFGRREDAIGSEVEGMGMGLYLVQQIVEAMGGALDLRSSSTGSEFIVRVPAAARIGG